MTLAQVLDLAHRANPTLQAAQQHLAAVHALEITAGLRQNPNLVLSGQAKESAQDESQASYEGWCRSAESRINWHNHVDLVYNLIRGCNPAPGAWTTLNGKKLQLFDARKHPVRTFAQVKGSIGAVVEIGAKSLLVMAQGGLIEVLMLKYDDGKKIPAPQFCAEAGVTLGAVLGA